MILFCTNLGVNIEINAKCGWLHGALFDYHGVLKEDHIYHHHHYPRISWRRKSQTKLQGRRLIVPNRRQSSLPGRCTRRRYLR